MSAWGQIAMTAVLLAVAVLVVRFVDNRLARRRGSVPTTPSSADAQGIRPANSGPMMVLLTIAAGCAAAAAVVGFVGRSDTQERNASDDATVNRSTCLSTANADWRASVGVLLMGYVAGEGQASAFVAAIVDAGPQVEEAILDGARDTQQIRDRGVELLASSVVNDARIGSETDPLCPFVAGDPSRTPAEPDRTDIDVDPGSSPDITTTEPAIYLTCDEARQAGVAPIREGEPGYSTELDDDRDGIACE